LQAREGQAQKGNNINTLHGFHYKEYTQSLHSATYRFITRYGVLFARSIEQLRNDEFKIDVNNERQSKNHIQADV
jgi:hypothetical protein